MLHFLFPVRKGITIVRSRYALGLRKSTLISLFIGLLIPLSSCVSVNYSSPQKMGWRNSPDPAPSLEEIAEIRSDLLPSLDRLQIDLDATNRFTRRRAAVVLELLAASGQPAQDTLIYLIDREYDLVTKAFMLRAFAEISPGSAEEVSSLKNQFSVCTNKVLKTYFAGTILKLGDVRESQVEFQYLLDSLNPVGSANEMADEAMRHEFWERRWAAAYMIAKLGRKAVYFIPALEHTADGENAPEWLNKQVWFTLRKITSEN